MAGEPRRPRPTWRPPGADGAAPKVERPATQILRVSDLRATAPDPRDPSDPLGSSDPPEPVAPGASTEPEAPVDLRGATTGRGLAEEPPSEPAPEPAARAGSPFQPFAARPDGLAQAPRSDNLPVLAIVGGLVAIGLAAVALVVVALLVGTGVVGEEGLGLAVADPAEEHVGDTDVGRVAEPAAPIRRPGGAAAAAPAAPTRADATIVLGERRAFRSIEVNCPQSGLRTRATFRDGRATVRELPVGEDCNVSFQGAEPARTTLRGGQTRRCVFGPTRCEIL